MKPMAILGVLLIAIGIAGLAVDNISFTERKTIVDAGPLKITADEQRTIPIPTIAGIIAVVAGAGLLFLGRARVINSPVVLSEPSIGRRSRRTFSDARFVEAKRGLSTTRRSLPRGLPRARSAQDDGLLWPGEADVVPGQAVENDLLATRLHHPFQAMIAVFASDLSRREPLGRVCHAGGRGLELLEGRGNRRTFDEPFAPLRQR